MTANIVVCRGDRWAYRSETGGHERHIKIMGVSKPMVLRVSSHIITGPCSVTFREVTRSGQNKGELMKDSKGKKRGYTHMLRCENGQYSMGPGWRKVS